MLADFAALRMTWPERGTELKGSSLNEVHVASTIALVRKTEEIFDAIFLDVARHPPDLVEKSESCNYARI